MGVPGVVGVTATGPDSEKTYYSSYGIGVAALIASHYPGFGPKQVARTLEQTANPITCPRGTYEPIDGYPVHCQGGRPHNSCYDYGEVDAAAAVRQ